MVHLVGRPAAVHQHRDGAQRRDCNERHQPIWAVGECQPDELARLQALCSAQVFGQQRGPSEHFHISNPFLTQHGQHFTVVYARCRVECRQRLRGKFEHATTGATHDGVDKLERSAGRGKVGEHCRPVPMTTEWLPV